MRRDDARLLHARRELLDPLRRRGDGHALLVAAGRAVAEERRAEPVDLDGDLRPRAAHVVAAAAGSSCRSNSQLRHLRVEQLPLLRAPAPSCRARTAPGHRHGSSSATVSRGSAPQVRSPQETIRSGCSRSSSASTASSAVALPCTSAMRRDPHDAYVRGRRPSAGSRRAGSAAPAASGRRSTRRARPSPAPPSPPRAAPGPARRRSPYVDRVVDERDRPVELDLEEAGARRELAGPHHRRDGRASSRP